MDMKRILQAMDGVATKPVVGADSMARFLRVVSEAEINQPVPAMPDITGLQAGQPKDLVDGSKVTVNADGTVSYQGGWGTYVYNAQGQHIKTQSPSMAGYSQETDTAGKVTQQNYNQGPLNMQKGSQGTNASYDLGPGVVNMQQAPGQPPTGSIAMRTGDVQEGIDKFLSIVKKNNVGILNEGKGPHNVALPVQMAMQHFQKTETAPVKQALGISKYFHKVEEDLAEQQAHKRQLLNQYASTIAERVLMKEGKAVKQRLDPKCWTGKHKEGTKIKGGVRVNNCVPNESVNEHEAGWERHGQGPGMQNYVVDEAPLEFDKDSPMSSRVYGHKGANSGSIEYRMTRARGQLQELAKMAERDDPLAWQHIARLFPELAMNIEQIDHGLRQLGSIRRKGGRNSKNIPQHLDPDVNETGQE